MKINIRHRLEEFIVIAIIAFDILAFLGFLPRDADFLKLIISWLLLGYLLYHLSITRLIFGEEKKFLDIALILSFFLMVLKEVVFFASEALREDTIFVELYRLIFFNRDLINYISLYSGLALIAVFSVYFAVKANVKKPSLMHVLHDEGYAKTLGKKSERFFIVLAVLISFFLFIFNLMMEWLAIAVDNSITVFAIVFYFFTAFRRHFRRFHGESFVFKVGDSAEKFYEKIIGLFHDKSRLLLGISGILVLHIITDIANFILPYIFGIKSSYIERFDSSHMRIFDLLFSNLARAGNFSYSLSHALVYFFNMVFIISFMFLPAYIWYKTYKKEGFRVRKWQAAMFFASFFVFLASPAFRIIRLNQGEVVGVDIQTVFLASNIFCINLIFLGCVLVFALVYLACLNHKVFSKLVGLGFTLIILFSGYYLSYFFYDTITYYWKTAFFMLSNSHIFLSVFFLIFMILSFLFYVVGFIAFVIEVKREYRHIKD